MNRNAIIRMLGGDWARFENLVRGTLHTEVQLLNSINEGIIANSGKQLRPMLGLLVSHALGGGGEEASRYAAAAEVIHNATLLHDDVVDESPTRRGKPTVASAAGPGAAVLIGDFWLSRSLDLIIGTRCQEEVLPVFAKTLSDLSEGEVFQMQKAGDGDTSEQDYLRIIYCKTASLFEAICRAAAISAGAPAGLRDAAARYGAATGMAFQIRDDIFDYGDPSGIGKPVGSDLKERKITLPLLGALRGNPMEGRIRALIESIPEHPEAMSEVRSFVLENGGIEYASGRLQDYIDDALAAASLFPPTPERDVLCGLAQYNAIRKA